MKKYLIVLLVIIISSTIAQTKSKKINITKTIKIVPTGKIWKLERDKPIIIQISEGTLKSGTLCNAMFRSNPGFILHIYRGDYNKADGYSIIIKNIEKLKYINGITYKVTPISIVDKNFNLETPLIDNPENVGSKEIVFKPGEMVFVDNCLVSIELTELGQSDLNKLIEKEKERNNLKANFNIPVNPEKYIESRTKPILKDSSLNIIFFRNKGLIYRLPGQSWVRDSTLILTMKLTIDDFEITSYHGSFKSFKVLNIKFNEALKMQEFQLCDPDGYHTHNLDISWNNSLKEYFVLLTAVDESEEYQFQNTQATFKQ
jgi:hypothetical protein